MLPLKHLIDDRDLVQNIADCWDWDKSSEEGFNYFRISSNAIYPIRVHVDETPIRAILRFAPSSEKPLKRLKAELSFMDYLRAKGYPVAAHIPNKAGAVACEIATEKGTYVANLFTALPGDSLEEVGLTPKLTHRVGTLLASLHQHAKNYQNHQNPTLAPYISARDYCNQIALNSKMLKTLPDHYFEIALQIRNQLEKVFESMSPERIGLIHYDFEMDNMLYCDTTDTLSVLDFDDAMIACFEMDLVRVLDNIEENFCESQSPEALKALQKALFEGYWSAYPEEAQATIEAPESSTYQILRSFMTLNWIYRVHYALRDPIETPLDWQISLKNRLMDRANTKLKALEVDYAIYDSREGKRKV